MTADTIYQTPDEWGRVTLYADLEGIEKIVENLRSIDEDWASISLSDCSEWTHVEGDVYEERGVRHQVLARFRPTGDGEYTFVEYVD